MFFVSSRYFVRHELWWLPHGLASRSNMSDLLNTFKTLYRFSAKITYMDLTMIYGNNYDNGFYHVTFIEFKTHRSSLQPAQIGIGSLLKRSCCPCKLRLVFTRNQFCWAIGTCECPRWRNERRGLRRYYSLCYF